MIVLSLLTVNETVREKELLSFAKKKKPWNFFCSVISHIYVGDSKIRIVYTNKYTEIVRVDNVLLFVL